MTPLDRDRGTDLLRAEDLAVGSGAAGITDATLGVHPGESVALLGTQRARAEILLRCLAGFVKPRRGRVLFGGAPVSEWSDVDRARLRRTLFGVIVDPRPTDSTLSVVDFVSRPLRGSGMAVDKARMRALAALDDADARHLVGRQLDDLSPVDRRLATIARAWTSSPIATFAIGPTDGLDAPSSRRVTDVLTSARHHPGAMLVVVTDDVELASRLDRRMSC